MRTLRYLLASIALLAGFVAAEAQEPGRQPDKTITLDYCPTDITASTGFEVVLRPGTENKVDLYVDNIDKVKCTTDASKKSLRISMKPSFGTIKDDDHTYLAVVTLTDLNSLTALKAETGAELHIDKNYRPTKIARLELKCFTGGELLFTGDAREVIATAATGGELYLSGKHRTLKLKSKTGSGIEYTGSFHLADMHAGTGGEITLTGTGDTVSISASSGGEVDGSDLTVKGGTLDADLSSEITIRCTDRRSITCDGKGDIEIIIAK